MAYLLNKLVSVFYQSKTKDDIKPEVNNGEVNQDDAQSKSNNNEVKSDINQNETTTETNRNQIATEDNFRTRTPDEYRKYIMLDPVMHLKLTSHKLNDSKLFIDEIDKNYDELITLVNNKKCALEFFMYNPESELVNKIYNYVDNIILQCLCNDKQKLIGIIKKLLTYHETSNIQFLTRIIYYISYYIIITIKSSKDFNMVCLTKINELNTNFKDLANTIFTELEIENYIAFFSKEKMATDA